MRHHCSFAILLLVLTVSGINGQNLAKDPASSKEYFFRGLARQSAGDINGAIADFSKSIGLDEGVLATYDSEKVKAGLAEAYCQRGQARMKQEHGVDGALADFNRAIVLNPRSINAYGQRALALHLKNSASQSNSQVVTNDLQKSRSAESLSQSSETTSPEVRTTLGRDSSL